jgi:hypothetical protein
MVINGMPELPPGHKLEDYIPVHKWKVVLTSPPGTTEADVQRFLTGYEPFMLARTAENKFSVLFDSEATAQKVAKRTGEKLPNGTMYTTFIKPDVPKRPLGVETRTVQVHTRGVLTRPDDAIIAFMFQASGLPTAIRYLTPPGKPEGTFEGEFQVEFSNYKCADRCASSFTCTLIRLSDRASEEHVP